MPTTFQKLNLKDQKQILVLSAPKSFESELDTFKKHKADFNRDTGWEVIEAAGYQPVRMVAIDEDWSALRYRRSIYVKR